MKKIHKITAFLLSFFIMFTLIPAVQVNAAADEYPTKIRLYMQNEVLENIYVIQPTDKDIYIENLKSKNKALLAKVTDFDCNLNGRGPNKYTLAFIVTKYGTYDVSYDVMKKGKKVKTVNAKVYAYPAPFSVSLSGVKGSFYSDKTSVKLSVKADKGVKISKIEVGTYEYKKQENGRIQSEMTYKTVKNNSKIKLGTKAHHDESDYISEDMNSKDTFYLSLLTAETQIRVTYKDSYTKQNEQYIAYYRGISK